MSQTLTGRVAGVFATKATVFVMSLMTTYLLARVLGPDGRGAYYLALLIPITLITLGQLGIPAALTYLTGRGWSLDGLRTVSVVLAGVLSIACIVPTLLARDFLRASVVPGTSDVNLTIAIACVPFLFVSTFAIGLLLGRQAIAMTNLLALGQAVATLVLLLVFVGAMGAGVDGAVTAFFLVSVGVSIAAGVAAWNLAPFRRPSLEPTGPLMRYALKVYPGSLASFFSYRADVFLLGIILGSAADVGLYVFAVSLAELLFYVADSVATAFFPHISAASRPDADRQVPDVSRTTLLVTAVAGLALIPFAVIGIEVALPTFEQSIPPFLVLLPGVVSLSLSKVLSGYVSGIGRPASVGMVAVVSLVVNVVANLALIPLLGIVGASLSSTISYTVNACLMVVIAAGLAGVRPRILVIPTAADARRVIRVGTSLATSRSPHA